MYIFHPVIMHSTVSKLQHRIIQNKCSDYEIGKIKAAPSHLKKTTKTTTKT